MNDKNRKLLDEVIEDRLQVSTDYSADQEDRKLAFEEAMKAIDRQNEIVKNDLALADQVKKQEIDVKKSKRELAFKGAEIVAIVVVGPITELITKRVFAKDICKWEREDTFTGTAGRSLGQTLFRWKDNKIK